MPRQETRAQNGHGLSQSDRRSWARDVTPPTDPPIPGVRFYPGGRSNVVGNNQTHHPSAMQWQSVVEYTEKGSGGIHVIPQVSQVETILLQGTYRKYSAAVLLCAIPQFDSVEPGAKGN